MAASAVVATSVSAAKKRHFVQVRDGEPVAYYTADDAIVSDLLQQVWDNERGGLEQLGVSRSKLKLYSSREAFDNNPMQAPPSCSFVMLTICL
jgi:hypothetical protein